MMSSKELVSSAIEFGYPERLPMAMRVSGQSDVISVKGKEPERKANSMRYIDEFGCSFEVLNNKTMGQPTDFPIGSIKELDTYSFPEPLPDEVADRIEGELAKTGDRYVTAYNIWFTFFERMHFLHGFTQTMEDLLLETRLMLDLADRILDYNLQTVRKIHERFRGRIHGIAMSDDWGNQTTTFISRKLFLDFFFPRYKKLFGTIRDLGMDVWLHSCGYVMEFIPLFIESGVQVLNLQQPRIFDLADLERFAGDVCFNIPIDIQNTMPRGTREEIEQEAAELLSSLALDRGGFIASEHPDYEGNGIDPIKGVWAYEAFKKADPYR